MAAKVRFQKELLDELLAGHDAKAVFERDGLLDDLKKALAGRILNAEGPSSWSGERAGGGQFPQRCQCEDGTHRQRQAGAVDSARSPGRFESALIAKYQRRFPGFDQKIIALYARGMTTCDIQARLRERGGHQTDLAGVAQHHRQMEPPADRLECGKSAIRDTVRRKICDDTCVISNIGSHTKFMTRPASPKRCQARISSTLVAGTVAMKLCSAASSVGIAKVEAARTEALEQIDLVQQRRVLDDQGVGLHHRLAQPDLLVVDAAERHHRSAHAFGAEARKRLRVPALEEGGHRQQLGARNDPLPAAAVDADLEHLLLLS